MVNCYVNCRRNVKYLENVKNSEKCELFKNSEKCGECEVLRSVDCGVSNCN